MKIPDLMAAIEVMRKVYPEIPAQTMLTLLYVAVEPGLSVGELGRRVGVSTAAISRNLSVLGSWITSSQKPGLRLLELLEDPKNRHIKRAYLTPAGQRIISNITSIKG